MNEPPPNLTSQGHLNRSKEEVDLWWGSYAGRAMVPSFAICIGLTVLIYWAARFVGLERGWLQLTITALAGVVWGVQLFRWGRRFFTWNYRLTTRYLYIDRGWRPLIARRILLSGIAQVAVRRKGLEKWLGIGDIVIWLDDPKEGEAILHALTNPRTAGDLIREAVHGAKENAVAAQDTDKTEIINTDL